MSKNSDEMKMDLNFQILQAIISAIILYTTKLLTSCSCGQAKANLITNSAAMRYIFRECGFDSIFPLRPKVGEVLTIPGSLPFSDDEVIHLLITRPSQRAPQITDDLFLYTEHLKASLLSS